jgi:ribosomal protein L37E
MTKERLERVLRRYPNLAVCERHPERQHVVCRECGGHCYDGNPNWVMHSLECNR